MSPKTLLAIPLIAAGITTANAESSRNYEFSGFDKIKAQAGLQVDVSYGEQHHVEISAKRADLFDKIIVKQDGDNLVLKRKENWSILGLLSWSENWNSDVKIKITTPLLSGVEATSGSNVSVSSFDLDNLALEASSGAELTVNNVTAGKLSLDASSGASLALTGTCDNLSADASSGANIDAAELNCSHGNVEANSGASINAQLSTSLKAEASSGGSIRISGSPQNVEIEKTFGGSINITN